jgi:DNA polymerase-3 subunit gamma/tau
VKSPEASPVAVVKSSVPTPVVSTCPTQAVALNWEQFQEEVSQAFPNIAPFLEMGRLVAIEGNLVTIGFAKQATVARGMLEKPDNIQVLASLCERLNGQPVRLRIVELSEAEPPGPTMAQIRAAKEQEQKLVLFERAKAHPVVKQALEIFGAELADVRAISNQKEVQE